MDELQILHGMEKEVEKRKVIEGLKTDTNTPKQYLDLGEHRGIWYYGRKYHGKDSIITSDGRMFVNERTGYKQPPELNHILEFMSYDNELSGDFGFMMNNTAAVRWIQGERVKASDIFCDVRELIDHYMDFGNYQQKSVTGLLAIFVMATYHYTLFEWFPNLLLNAPRESGKSKCGDIMLQLCFKGFDIGASAGATPAQFYRTIDMCRGTIRIDEYENLDTDGKKLCDQLLNAGVSRDSYVIRNEKRGTAFIPTKFPIFCPKIASNISGINTTTLTRFIAIKWSKTLSIKANRKPMAHNNRDVFLNLRDDLYIYGLGYWEPVKNAYDSLETGLKGRFSDNWRPLLAVAKVVDTEKDVGATKAVEEYIKNYKDITVETNDSTEEFFHFLKSNVDDAETFYTAKTIAGFEGIIDLLCFTKSPAHWVGKKLTEYNFQRVRKSEGRGYILSKRLVEDNLQLYFNPLTNDTNDKMTQTSLMTAGIDDVSDVCDNKEISPQDAVTDYEEPSDDDLCIFVSEIGVKGYAKTVFSQKYGEQKTQVLIERGLLYENRDGFLKVNNKKEEA